MIPNQSQFPTSNVRVETPGIPERKALINAPDSEEKRIHTSRATVRVAGLVNSSDQ